MLALLARRLDHFDARRLARRAAAGSRLARDLPRGLAHAGGDLASHTHWVFPIRARDPDAIVGRLRRAGFHATRRGSSLAPIDAPRARPDLDPVCTRALMSRIVFLPAYPEMPERAIRRMLRALHQAAKEELAR
jgi:hypothetical protein